MLPVNGRQPRGLRRQAILESLLADVFEGRLRPGQHLVTEELAKRFGASHTPIREALIALAGIGVIELLPNRGATVRQVTGRDVREICQVRRALECEAIRCACGRIDLAELHSLAAELKKLQADTEKPSSVFIERARELDTQLHDLIAAHCDNGLLAGEINRLKILFRACRDIAWQYDRQRNDFHRLQEETHQHLAIVEALLAGDRKAACLAMSRHIRSGLRYWSRALPTHSEHQPDNERAKAARPKRQRSLPQ